MDGHATISTRTLRGAQLFGMKTLLVRTGKFRPDALERSSTRPRRRAQLDRERPGLDRPRAVTRVGVDLIEIERVRRSLERYPASRIAASPPPSRRTATRARTRPRATRAGSPARRRSGRRSDSASRGRSPGRTSRSPAARSRPCGSRDASPRGRSGSVPGAIDLSMTHSRELASAVAVVTRCLSRSTRPTRCAPRRRYPATGDGAGADGAGRCARWPREVLRLFPDAHRIAVVCGGGSNGGDGRIAARILRDGRARRGRDDRRRAGRRDRRRAVRDGLPRRAARRGGGDDRADQRRRRTGGLRRRSLGRRRVDRRDRRRGSPTPRSP